MKVYGNGNGYREPHRAEEEGDDVDVFVNIIVTAKEGMDIHTVMGRVVETAHELLHSMHKDSGCDGSFVDDEVDADLAATVTEKFLEFLRGKDERP